MTGDFVRAFGLDRFLRDFVPIWNEYGGYSNVQRLSKLFIYSPLLLLRSVGISINPITPIYWVYFTALATISGVYVFRLSSYVSGFDAERYYPFFASAGLFYVLSTYVVEQSVHPAIKYGFYLAPVILYAVMKGSSENRRSYFVFAGVVWALASGDIHWPVFGSIVIFGYLTYDFINRSSRMGPRNALGAYLESTAIVFTTYLLLNAYWIIPLISSQLTQVNGASGVLFDRSSLTFQYRNAIPVNLFGQQANVFLDERYGRPPRYLRTVPSILPLILLSAMGLLSFIADRNNERLSFFGILFVGTFFLSAGPNLFPTAFYGLMFDVLPFPVARLFRTPKFHQFLLLALAPMLATSGIGIYRILRGYHIGQIVPTTFIVLVLTFSLVGNYPLQTGDFNGYLQTTDVPEDYERTIDTMGTGTEYKTVWGPHYQRLSPTWHSNPVANDNPSKSIGVDISPRPVLIHAGPLDDNVLDYLFWQYRESPHQPLVTTGEVSHVGDFLAPLNVKYLVIHNDLTRYESETQRLISGLKQADGVSLMERNGNVYLFAVEDPAPRIRVAHRTVFAPNGVISLESLYTTQEVEARTTAVTFDSKDYSRTLAELVLVHGSEEAPIPYAIQGSERIYPSETGVKPLTSSGNSANEWVSTQVSSNSFKRFLVRHGVPYRPQSGINRGIIISPSGRYLPAELDSEGSTPVRAWNFTQGTQAWQVSEPYQTVTATGGELQVSLTNSPDSWAAIRSPFLKIDPNGSYHISLSMKGVNVHKVHLSVAEFDRNRVFNSQEKVSQARSGTFNSELSVNFVPKDDSTRFIRLIVRHGRQTEESLPNEIYLDDVNVYDVSKFARPVNVTIPFVVDQPANYRFFVRHYANPEGGRIGVTINDTRFLVDTEGPSNRFMWEDLGVVPLESGAHELELENIEGFNGVNEIAYLPDSEYREMEKEMANRLRNKTTLYLLEAESDFRGPTLDVNVSKNASAGRFVRLKSNGILHQNVGILRSGSHTIVLRGQGQFVLSVVNRTYPVNISNAGVRAVGPINLSRGSQNVTIRLRSANVRTYGYESERETTLNGQGFIGGLDNQAIEGNRSLRISTSNIEPGWGASPLPPIRVEPGGRYTITTHMKARNVEGSHIVVAGYNQSSESWEQITQTPSGRAGTMEWNEYRATLRIPPEITRIRLIPKAGWVKDPGEGNATTWFDDLRIERVPENRLDAVWIYSPPEGEPENLNDEALAAKEKPAVIEGWTRSNTGRYEVEVHATEPYMLAFAEAYDPQWVAEIDTENGTKQIEPTSLYGMTNGFWIDESGVHTVTIRYRPQRWFNFGVAISGITFILLFAYLIFDWRRRRMDLWALRLNRKIRSGQTQVKSRIIRTIDRSLTRLIG